MHTENLRGEDELTRAPAPRTQQRWSSLHLRLGEREYSIGERFSRGKLGESYACRDLWGTPLILQTLRPLSRSYAQVRERWLGEAAQLVALRHRHLVPLVDAGEHEGAFCLISEREHFRLDQALADGTWNGSAWFVAVAAAVLGALDHLHRAGRLHLNLHPRNVFTGMALGRIAPVSVAVPMLRLGDAPKSALLGRVEMLNTGIAHWLTPPEHLNPSQFGAVDHRIDLYQAGLLLLAVLLGRIPRFTFEDAVAGKPRELALDLPSGFAPAVARALAPRAEERYPTALAFWREIRRTACGAEG